MTDSSVHVWKAISEFSVAKLNLFELLSNVTRITQLGYIFLELCPNPLEKGEVVLLLAPVLDDPDAIPLYSLFGTRGEKVWKSGPCALR